MTAPKPGSDFADAMRASAALVEDGAYLEATALLRSLLERPLGADESAMVCVNLAVVSDKTGDTEGALGWYDEAARRAEPAMHAWVLESKAAYLAGVGRHDESRALYERLLASGTLEGEALERVRHNVAYLRGEG